MYLIIASIIIFFVFVYFTYQYFYTRHMNRFGKTRRKLMDINAFRIVIVVVGLLAISGYVITNLTIANAKTNDNLNYYDNYISNYDLMTYSNPYIKEIYTDYNLYFGGMYLDNGQKILLIRKDIPEDGLNILIDNNISYKLVNFNYHELLSARIQIEKVLYNYDGVALIYTDEINNHVVVTLLDGTPVAKDLDGFIQSGILRIEYTDHLAVAT